MAEQVAGEVLTAKQVGGFVHLTIVAGPVAERARPGMFVVLGVGGETSGTLVPRPFWLHRVRPSGVYGGTVEVVFTVRGPATRWLAALKPHDPLPVTGPLGRPFALPKAPVACAVVGHGYGASPLFMLTERLRERDCAVHMVLGGENERGLFGALEARRVTRSVTVVTSDGSVGAKGGVHDALPAVLAGHQVELVYGCGPLDVLRSVADLARSVGAGCQLAMEAPMACGVGLCLSCVVPVKDGDDATVPMRCCVEGPVFDGDRVDWTLLAPR